MNPKGRFIALEGGEGAGKSTAVRFMAQWLAERGRRVVMTREPGGSPLAESIRAVVLDQWQEGMPIAAEVLLMYAARAAHLQSTILPALASGSDVICDRFTDSTHAYQGSGHGFPARQLRALDEMVLQGIAPDLTIVFDIDPDIGLERTVRRGMQNRFERETREFMLRVRQGFLSRAQADPARYAIVDAGQSLSAVQASLTRVLEPLL